MDQEKFDEAVAGIMIQLSRIYDLLALSLDDQIQEKIVELHNAGGLLTGPPIINDETYKAWEES